MGIQNVPNRSIIASGRFSGTSDGSSDANDHSKLSSMTGLKDDSSPSVRSRQSVDKSLFSSLKDTVDSFSRRDASSSNDWQGLPSLTDLVALSNSSLKTSSSVLMTRPAPESYSTDPLTQHSAGVLLDELLRGPASESHTISDSLGDDLDSDQQIKDAKRISQLSVSSDALTLNSTDFRSTQVVSELPFVSGFSSSSPLLKSNDSIESPTQFASISEDGFFQSRDIGPPNWTGELGAEFSDPLSHSSRALSAAPGLLASPMYSDDLSQRVASPALRGGADDLSENPSLRLDSSFNSMLASRLSPSTLLDTRPINDQGGPVGPGWNQSYVGNSCSASDFNGSSAGRESQSGEGRGDLSKTNELLQQLIEEVRKGRQGFLPISDRNSTY